MQRPALLRFLVRSSPALAIVAATIGCTTSSPATAPAPGPAPAIADPIPAWSFLRAKYDADGDGRITPLEYSRGAEAFARLDRNGDGAITAEDFQGAPVPPGDLVAPMALVRMFGAPNAESVSLEEIEGGFARIDRNGDGRLDRTELGAGAPSPEFLASVFSVIDADRDGALTLEEIRVYFARRDVDGDGRLSVRERMSPGAEPRVGAIPAGERETAPDFTLAALGGGAPVTLSSFRGKQPVALIFGSFT